MTIFNWSLLFACVIVKCNYFMIIISIIRANTGRQKWDKILRRSPDVPFVDNVGRKLMMQTSIKLRIGELKQDSCCSHACTCHVNLLRSNGIADENLVDQDAF